LLRTWSDLDAGQIDVRASVLKPERNSVMTRNLKKGRRIGRNPKTGSEVPISPRRIIVFQPSAVLKRRINGHTPVALGDEPVVSSTFVMYRGG
jgi:hypothetical protein